MYLEYNILDSFNLLLDIINNYIMLKAIILSGIILMFLFIINKDNDILKYFILIINLLLIIALLNYYKQNIFIGFNHYLNNLYGYVLNSIVFLIIFPITYIKKTINKTILFIMYMLNLITITSILFITYYYNNNTLVVLGEVYPLVKFGNYLYIINLLILIFNISKNYLKKS